MQKATGPGITVPANSPRFFEIARTVPKGGLLTVTNYRLEGDTQDSILELERYEVWHPTAKIVISKGRGVPPVVRGPPDTR